MWIEVFKTGAHTDSGGNERTYDAGNLDEIARIYNERSGESESLEAPVVKGHPGTDEPAYGWVERLARRGSRLFAKLKKLNPEFVSEVRNGAFRRVSIALYPDQMLRHIGFLGAAAPAVKGLQPAAFAEGVEYSEFETERCTDCTDFNASSEGMLGLMVRLDDSKRENLIISERCLALEEKLSLYEKQARLKVFREYADGLIDTPEGSVLTPAITGQLVDMLEMAYLNDKSSGREYTEPGSSVGRIKEFVQSLKPLKLSGEFASHHTNIVNDAKEMFEGDNVHPERLELHKKALALRNNMPGISYEEAVLMAGKS